MLSFLNPLFEAMGSVLSWLYGVIPNYGVAIILLTILVRLALYPLTAKQARSMIAMQRVQPEIKKLQAKYKDDKQKLNEEMMKFYKENKINPFGGCLPLVAQMPIFIALFRVLNDPQKYVPHSSQFYAGMCQNAACKPANMDFFGMNLSLSASDAHGSFVNALPYWILVGLVVVTAYLQQKQTMRNSPQSNPQMQIIGKVMPLVFAFISINLPAGVVLYFFVSNLWQMGQQELVFRRMAGTPIPTALGDKGTVEAKSSDSSTSTGGLLAKLMRPAPTDGTKGAKGVKGANPKAVTNGDNKPGSAAEKQPKGDAAAGPKPKPAGRSAPQGRRRSNKKRRR